MNVEVKNNIDLINKIEDKQIPSDHVLISLDVSALYTNVDKDWIKNSIAKRYREIARSTNIALKDLLEVTDFLIGNTYFQFNDHYYKQTSGLYADIEMDDLETECLNSLSFNPIFLS